MHNDVESGPLWNPRTNSWYNKFVQLPVPNDHKLILVSKAIVRYRLDYDQDEYYRHYLLPELRSCELAQNSSLVQLLKNGRRRVTKKALQEKYGSGKSVLVEQTLRHPRALDRYRAGKATASPPLSHEDLAQAPSDIPNWDLLLQNVLSTPLGLGNAYEKTILSLLTALFYPALTDPAPQYPIHNGRKRIDIKFTNVAHKGFFYWLALHYCAPSVWVECKNYTNEISNPELDQLSSRFSPRRGQFGILMCRNFDNKALFLSRCRDTADDGHGYVVVIDDDDLKRLVSSRTTTRGPLEFPLLADRFQDLVN